MSDQKRKTVTKKDLEEEWVDNSEKTTALQTALYECSRREPFLGSVLQCLNIMYTHMISTAGIMFNTEAKRWDMFINPKYFCHKLNNVIDAHGKKIGPRARMALLFHELSHITNKHPFRVPFLKISPRKRMLMNVAADMAINQYIRHLPRGCSSCPPVETRQPCKNKDCPGRAIMVEDWYDMDAKGNKVPWEKDKTMEYYYEKLLTKLEEPDDDDDGEGDADGEGGSAKGIPKTLDEHMWDGSAEEKDMLEATEDLIKRAMIKQRCDYSELPASVKELLEHIETRKIELNYKAEILAAIKKSASGHERKQTWTRKSRRFGSKAPGTKVGDLPKLEFYLDTSGSISIEELNEFLEIADNFLKAGSRKCRLNLFHTSNYFSSEYKLGQRIGDNGIQSKVQQGGTCLRESLMDIHKRKPDLAVFVTDGYYSDVRVEEWMRANDKWSQCLFIISKDGDENHPLKRLGKTIKIPQSGQGNK